MKIVWDWSLDSETTRILEITHSVANGFYGLHHFIPLPWTHDSKYLGPGVYLPNLKYQSIPNYWAQVARLNVNSYPLSASKTLFSQTREQLNKLGLLKPNFDKLQVDIVNYLPLITNFIKQFIPKAETPTTIIIHPSYFGTVGSFSHINKQGEITIFLRIDQGIHSFVECLLTSILRPTSTANHNADWSESEYLIDWIISSSALSQILPQSSSWKGTIESTRSQLQKNITKESELFLALIGSPSRTHHRFSTTNNEVFFDNNSLSSLTQRETTLLAKLIEISPLPISIDIIGDILFHDDEKFSLAAINQAISRLRAKLNELGISSSYLATASGTGYYLRN